MEIRTAGFVQDPIFSISSVGSLDSSQDRQVEGITLPGVGINCVYPLESVFCLDEYGLRFWDERDKAKGRMVNIFRMDGDPAFGSMNRAILATFLYYMSEVADKVSDFRIDEGKVRRAYNAVFEMHDYAFNDACVGVINKLRSEGKKVNVDMNDFGRVVALMVVNPQTKFKFDALARKCFFSEPRECAICMGGIYPMINSVVERDRRYYERQTEAWMITRRDKGGHHKGVLHAPVRVYSPTGVVYSAWPRQHVDHTRYVCQSNGLTSSFMGREEMRLDLEANCRDYFPGEQAIRALYHGDEELSHFHYTVYSKSPGRYIRLRTNDHDYMLSPLILDMAVRATNLALRLCLAIRAGTFVKLKRYIDVPNPVELLFVEAGEHEGASGNLAQDILLWYFKMVGTMSVSKKLLDLLPPRFSQDMIWGIWEKLRRSREPSEWHRLTFELCASGKIPMSANVYRMWKDRNVVFPYNVTIVYEKEAGMAPIIEGKSADGFVLY